MLDDTTRRQLRFSLFLQVFAAVMMAVALGVRVTSTGWDGITGLLAVAVVVFATAAVFTFRYVRSG